MKIKIIPNNFICTIASFFNGGKVAAVTFRNRIYIRPEYVDNPILLNHERIHAAQYKELGVYSFLAIYYTDWFRSFIKTRDSKVSYFNIRFEQEAYFYQEIDNYLDTRKPMAWDRFTIDKYSKGDLWISLSNL